MSDHIPTLERRLAHRAAAAANPDETAPNSSGNTGNNGNNSGNDTSGNSQSQGSDGSGSQTSASTDTGTAPSTTSEPTQPTQTSTSSQSSTTSTSTTQATPSSTSTSVTPITTSSTAATSTEANTPSSTLSTTSSTSSKLSSNSASSTPVSVSTSTHISTVTPTNAAAAQTSSFASVSRIFSSASSVVGAESTSSARASGAINTGTIVGGIAGALAGLAVLGFLVAFYIRRINRRKRAQRFEAAQFRRSAMVLDDSDPLPVPRPLEMVQNRGNNFTDSVTSTTSPGMAGAGAYRFQEDHRVTDTEQGLYHDNGAQHYYEENPASLLQRAPLQPRQQYTFGEIPVNGTQQKGRVNSGDWFDDSATEAHLVGQAHGDYEAYFAGAHPSAGYGQGQSHAARSSIGSRVDEADAYGGI